MLSIHKKIITILYLHQELHYGFFLSVQENKILKFNSRFHYFCLKIFLVYMRYAMIMAEPVIVQDTG